MARNQTISQLSEPSTSSMIDTGASVSHTFQVTVANINTNVVLNLLGSVDGISAGILIPDTGVVTGSAISNGVITITANGTYIYKIMNNPLTSVAVKFVSESGGTDATVNVKYMGE